ncbi:hypothetical protein DTO166G4_2527 [Paecilomyces variotii]|nr:hypothetical protein DTO166G4_2527 [Paecilomyces variotii]KAJ9227990.1 hypothetical protein DTO166G5_8968 [Paecilomyces variotii]KAJ9263717.1 hypothetical protein DTO195F2_2634 [Paecilomyces variotii]KAJ9314829.1 hypothetical protein DTO271D3_4829 [Paecilomyces variotii]KAJ9370237.1 hypothetical protein DTO282E5_5130 [Paecilomyces variotii]
MADAQASSWDRDALRARFCLALSDMYKQEVPLYADLIEIVNEVDDNVVSDRLAHLNGASSSLAEAPYELPPRHRVERHGAIRLGTPYELTTIRRLFAIFGMYPVGYYDLTVVGFPLHATAFRPVETAALNKHPFRVFTTLLRQDLLSEEIRNLVGGILSRRKLFTDRLLELIETAERNHGLAAAETDELLSEALKTFKWHSAATVTIDEYNRLKAEHPIVADIASFPSAHINHLTPRTLDIDLVQKTMVERGIPSKERIEGPPPRTCEILLRQTSFKALEERVRFYSDQQSSWIDGSHTARFGEIEQRGAAVTRKGRELYDKLLSEAYRQAQNDSDGFDGALRSSFQNYPDNWLQLRSEGLIFVRYKLTSRGQELSGHAKDADSSPRSVSELIRDRLLDFDPITYEDFLPVSAAGIFTSNLKKDTRETAMRQGKPDRENFERNLGTTVSDEFLLYEEMERNSLEECRIALGLDTITKD